MMGIRNRSQREGITEASSSGGNRRSRTTTTTTEAGNVINTIVDTILVNVLGVINVAVKKEKVSTHKNPILVGRNDEIKSVNVAAKKEKRSTEKEKKGNLKSIDDDDSELEAALLQIAIQESMSSHSAEPDDPKGKKLITVVVPDTNVEESPQVEPDEYCDICMEPKFRYECFDIKGCSHSYCASCVCQYVEAKIEENVSSIRCPDPSCKEGFLEPEMCRMILNPDVFDRWGVALCEAMIGAMKFYCPFKDCSALLVIDGEGGADGKQITQAKCPHCLRLFCAQCKVPWHLISCKEYRKLGVDERGKEDLMLSKMAKSCQWQRCPVCKFYVEKISGCTFMKCRCGHKFCYGCAKTMGKDHYCQNCKRLY